VNSPKEKRSVLNASKRGGAMFYVQISMFLSENKEAIASNFFFQKTGVLGRLSSKN
jgi:hypothetical protein